MPIINMVHNIKELFPDYVVFIKIGTFFETYNNDSCIMSYLFKYKIKTLVSSDTVCGFPVSSINKVKYILENKNINYLILDKKHNYEEIEKMNYKKKNKYKELLTESISYIDKINRIDKICKYLNNNPSVISSVENLIYER